MMQGQPSPSDGASRDQLVGENLKKTRAQKRQAAQARRVDLSDGALNMPAMNPRDFPLQATPTMAYKRPGSNSNDHWAASHVTHQPRPQPVERSFNQWPDHGSGARNMPTTARNQYQANTRAGHFQAHRLSGDQAEMSATNRQRGGYPFRSGNRGHGYHNATVPPLVRADGLPGNSQTLFNSPYRGPPNGRSLFESSASLMDQSVFLERIASVEIRNSEIEAEELMLKEAFRLLVEDVCQKAISRYERDHSLASQDQKVSLQCYGSLSSGFAMRSSDMDLALVSPASIDRQPFASEIPRLLERALLDAGYGARLLTKTRVPIIKLCERPTAVLRQALLDARAAWEDGRDHPPSKKPTNSPKKARSGSKNQVAPPIQPLSVLAASDVDTEASNAAASEPDPIAAITSSLAASTLQPAIQQSREQDEVSSPSLPVGIDPQGAMLASAQNALEAKPLEQEDLKRDTTVTEEAQRLQQEPAKASALDHPDQELVRRFGLAMSEGWYSGEDREVIHHFITQANAVQSDRENALALDQARQALRGLPDVLSKFREIGEKALEFPKSGVGIQCDINFSNRLAIHNTTLLRCYSYCDPRVRPMVLFVKTWAKKRKINSAYNGTLSSYGYVLMVLHYLMNIARPPVIPNLQMEHRRSGDFIPPEESVCEGYDIRFWRVEHEIQAAANHGALTANRDSIGVLLAGFFRYYAHQGHLTPSGGFNWTRDTLSLRTWGGLISKAEKNWTAATRQIVESTIPGHESTEIRHRFLLAIEDPFELDHNVARPVDHNGIVAIRDNFRRAERIIGGLGMLDGRAVDLFEEAPDPPSRRTYFGPNPNHPNQSRRRSGNFRSKDLRR